MASEEDDFFGLNKMETLPFPDAFRRRKRSNDGTSDESTDDFFESTFFPELSRDGLDQRGSKSDFQNTGKDFFDENFFVPTSGPPHGTELASNSAFQSQRRHKSRSQIPNDLKIRKSEYEKELEKRLTGRQQIWDLIDPVWKCTSKELVDMMAKRVIYETDDIIAFDKPYQMAYSSGPKDQAQMDRILQDLKKRVVPGIDRLYLVNSLDKDCTGVILFAKSSDQQRKVKKLIDENHALYRFRCLCKNSPAEPKARISIPLIKVLREKNFKLCPLIGSAKRSRQLYHFETDYKLVNENRSTYISLIDAFTKRSLPHLVRSHFFYGINCPIIGDSKYVRPALKINNPLPTMLSPNAMQKLELRKSDIRKLPMFMHLAEVHVPESTGGKFSVVRAETPAFFIHVLKKLHLLYK